MRHAFLGLLAVTSMMLGLVGCQTEPKTQEQRDALADNAEAAVSDMKTIDDGLDDVLNKAHSYAVFPEVGKGGVIVGGAYGRGVVYRGGQMIGYADLTQATAGLQAGGQSFKEIIAFENEEAFNKFKSGKLKLAGNASAVALKAGASTGADFQDGVMVITHPNGGLMFEVSIGGQQFTYTPMEDVRGTSNANND